MGLLHQQVGPQFDLRDLDLFDGPPLRGVQIITNMAVQLLEVPGAAFVAFDVLAAEAVIRGRAGQLLLPKRYSLSGSAVSAVSQKTATIGFENLGVEASERTELGIASLLAAAVSGPDQKAIGALVAWDTSPRDWSEANRIKLYDLAYLVSQEIVLRASFATLQLMATERVSRQH